MATRTGFVFLGAEVEDPEEGVIPPFVSTQGGGRNRHDRADLHFGEQSAVSVLIDEALGTLPAGSTLEQALRFLWSLTVEAEGGFHWFTLSAYSDLALFWRDQFDRTEAVDLGARSSGGPTRFGDTAWQRLDEGTMDVSVNGDEAEFVGTISTNSAEFVGYPTFESGEVYLEVFFPFDIPTAWTWRFQPWRDDVYDAYIQVRLFRVGGSWRVVAEAHDDRLQPYEGETLLLQEFQTSNIVWFAARFVVEAPGGTMTVKIWERSLTEPVGTEDEARVPNYNTGEVMVAVGASGKAESSLDGVTWTPRTANQSTTNLGDVVWGLLTATGAPFGVQSGLWLLCGGSNISTSPDGITWTSRNIITSGATGLRIAEYGAGGWVVATSGRLFSVIGNPATATWVERTHNLADAISGCVWAEFVWVIVGENQGKIATSFNGTSWTSRTSPINPTNGWLEDVAFGAGLFVAIGGEFNGSDDDVKVVTSPDGITWTNQPTGLINDYPNCIAYGEGLFVAVGQDQSFASGYVMTSPDGINWTENTGHGMTTPLNGLAYINGLWVATSNSGKIYTANDPTGAWTLQTTGFSASQVTGVRGRPAWSGNESPRMTVSNSSDSAHSTMLLDNLALQHADLDPVRIYHAFSLNAYVPFNTITDDFTLDAIAKKKLTGSFTLNAFRKPTFTLDAQVGTPTITQTFTLNGYIRHSFTLNAYVGGESGLLGSHTLGQHRLGGE